MGTSTYDKDQVFDVEQHMEAGRPIDEVVEMFTRVMDMDQWFAKGQWYAMGRMFHEPAPLKDIHGQPDLAGSAAGFAYLFQEMMRAFKDRERGDTVPLHTAWATYVASLGGTIEP